MKRKQEIPDQKISITIIMNTTHGCNIALPTRDSLMRAQLGESSLLSLAAWSEAELLRMIFDGDDCGSLSGFDATDHSCSLLGHSQAGFGKGAGTWCSG